jgi:hypothetical protein
MKNPVAKVRIALMSAALVAASGAALAQDRARDEAACRSDSRRLCRTIDPDGGQGAILACLQKNRSRLSRACRNLLESHGQ